MIINSKFSVDPPQRDGSVWVTEKHECDDGRIISVNYLCDTADGYEDRMASRVPMIEAQLAEEETQKAEAVTEASAQAKADAYVKALPDITLAAAGLTPEEIAVVKAAP